MGYNHFRYARRVDDDVIKLIHNDETQLLTIDKSTANQIDIRGGGTTATDDLYIYANANSNYSSIRLLGAGPIYLRAGANNGIAMSETNTSFFAFIIDGNDSKISSYDNKNIHLSPNGTGLVKFGTHSALSGESVTGYITIKDAGGTERKIAVVS